ncbi:MAG: N-acetylmuramic acid 6-phosphate etherase [Paracoccaceae bacterium]
MLRQSEQRHPKASDLDLRDDAAIAALMLDAQRDALNAVAPARPNIVKVARAMAETLQAGGSVAYAGAGSSALMALADALELPGTFGIARARVRIHMAGGLPGQQDGMRGATEDDAEAARRDAGGLGAGDLAIVVAASGSTPYALAFARTASDSGATVAALANTADAPLFALADHAILLATPPEIVAGSTRLGAGTAQKIALNMISTLAGIRLGHVHDGYMVNLVADNAKLRDRAARIVAAIADCSEPAAQRALGDAEGHVKPAVLLALGADTPARALTLLEDGGGNLRRAIETLTEKAG